MAQKAIKSAPGVLAVTVNFEKRQATIGTEKGDIVPMAEILGALESIGFRGEVAEPAQ